MSPEETKIRDLIASPRPVTGRADLIVLTTEIDRLRTALSEAEERVRVAVEAMDNAYAELPSEAGMQEGWTPYPRSVIRRTAATLTEALLKLRQPGRDQ